MATGRARIAWTTRSRNPHHPRQGPKLASIAPFTRRRPHNSRPSSQIPQARLATLSRAPVARSPIPMTSYPCVNSGLDPPPPRRASPLIEGGDRVLSSDVGQAGTAEKSIPPFASSKGLTISTYTSISLLRQSRQSPAAQHHWSQVHDPRPPNVFRAASTVAEGGKGRA